ncbi:hypothetical protein [Amycolatopsis antarctica]|uniref:hypothetical protein n=1 Tax=Amycolatopsis antarctica TaxID=1854586 RepID=UPI0010550D57|nr:hypothetical protein [Amycolatopsis antarctica]
MGRAALITTVIPLSTVLGRLTVGKELVHWDDIVVWLIGFVFLTAVSWWLERTQREDRQRSEDA